MTYLHFLIVFVALPALALLVVVFGMRIRARHLFFVLGLAVIAFLYATPWDNFLVWRGIWDYGNDRVIGTIGYVPIEEYMFFVLQVFLTGMWTLVVERYLKRNAADGGRADSSPVDVPFPWFEGTLYAMLGLAGALAFLSEKGLYFALIAVWSAPICLFQWWFSPRYLARNRTWLAAAIVPPSLFLGVADWYAIKSGIWSIADATRSGIEFAGLPFEEALFFTITNVMVVQGLVLLLERDSRVA
jgi:lycopene cyclase domain-containing protein